MNRRTFIRKILPSAILTGSVGIFAGCDKFGEGVARDPNVDYYTCTMHPSVRSQDPNGKCPICSMNLVPVMKKGADEHARGMFEHGKAAPEAEFSEFKVPVERQQQIGVTYAAVEKKALRRAIRSVGMVAPDRSRQWSFVARVEGYVQKLFVTSPGEWVEEGAPLLTIYAPELLTAEREFVNLLETRVRATGAVGRANGDRLIEASRRRLEQWNVTAKQIAELEKARKPSEFLTLVSPFQGVVQEAPVDQGRRVAIGDPLVTVADLSIVWVWVELYENEMPMIGKGQKVNLTATSNPGQVFSGEICLIDPFINETTRTAKVRIDIPNPDLTLRPGMYMNSEIAVDAGEGLAIPVSAVMPNGLRTLVFVDRGEGKLEPRLVQLGGQFGDDYEVRGGLTEGERVVASANFLIDAESQVQGAVKSFREPVTGASVK
jgi:membrane fusion protein, copper/silver efflux system